MGEEHTGSSDNLVISRRGFDAEIQGAWAHCSKLRAEGRLPELLSYISNLVAITLQHPIYKNRALYYRDLDNVLKIVSSDLYKEHVRQDVNSLNVIIGSQFGEVGGHSRVARDFTALSGRSLVVITDVFEQFCSDFPAQDRVRRFFDPAPVIFVPKGDLWSKTLWLVALIKNLQPGYVTCLNHYHDPVPIVATACAPVGKKIYHHHCDHSLSLGASLKNYLHVDTNDHNRQICAANIGTNCITLDLHDSGLKGFEIRYDHHLPLNTISSGGKVKYAFAAEAAQNAYPEVVSALIRATAGVHHHIGPLDDAHRAQIDAVLDRDAVPRDRFVYWGAVLSIETIMKTVSNPVFVPSFPVPGGLTLVEVMASGIPLLINHDSVASGEISASAFKTLLPDLYAVWRDLGELSSAVSHIRENYADYSAASKKRFIDRHAQAVFSDTLRRIKAN